MPTLETETDYYALLGVDPGADAALIRKAVVGEQRRCGARQNSPDLAARQAAERYALQLTEVRDVLLDPGRRALYDVQRVEALPTWVALQPAPSRGARSRRRLATLGLAVARPSVGLVLILAAVVFVATRISPPSSTAAVAMPSIARLGTPVLIVADVAQPSAPIAAPPTPPKVLPTEPSAPAPTRPAAMSRALPDEVPVALSGMPLLTSIVPPPTEPFSLAGGRYSLAWSVAGRQPCDFVITIADPIRPALARTTLSNHILNRSDGKPAQGQTTVTLNGGKYRLEAYSDTCAWSLVLRAS